MSDLRKAAKMALECLEYHWDNLDSELEDTPYVLEAKQALRQALEQPEQEPVATVVKRQYEDGTYAGNALDWTGRNSEDDFPVGTKLYTAPPKREWISLTDEDIDLYALDVGVTANKAPAWLVTYVRDIEAKLKHKNEPA